jgi:hypothetical protein
MSAKIRWTKSEEPETPPEGRAFLWYDNDGSFKIKRDDGFVQNIIGQSFNVIVEYFTLDQNHIDNAQIQLQFAPSIPDQTVFDIISNGPQFYSDDFIVTGNILSWEDKPIDGILSIGDRIRVQYVKI